jgi:hypothetical protein
MSDPEVDEPTGMNRAVRQIKAPGEIYRIYDTRTDLTRFIKNVVASAQEGQQVLQLSETADFQKARQIVMRGEKRFRLWDDIVARYYFDKDRNTWRTIFWVLPSVRVNPMHQRRNRRERDARGPDVKTASGSIEGRRPVTNIPTLYPTSSCIADIFVMEISFDPIGPTL